MTGGSSSKLDSGMDRVPSALWANAVRSGRNSAGAAQRFLPQAIGHRGYKAAWPENTMAAFRGAVEVGAHAVETDLHLSADGVVILSHDADLKRCFGVDKAIADCSWADLAALRTVRQPQQPMPRLSDLLEWLAEPENHAVWVLLDVKIDDDADKLLSAVAATLDAVPAKTPWDQRIVVGCWNATFIQAARRLLPSYPLANISWYPPYSDQFLRIPNLGFNVLQRSLIGPLGARFMSKIHDADRQLFVWTVNDERWMEWCLNKNAQGPVDAAAAAALASSEKGSKALSSATDGEEPLLSSSAPADATSHLRLIDGVITDDPKLFLEVCARWEDEQDGTARPGPRPGPLSVLRTRLADAFGVVYFQAMAGLFYMLMRFYYKRLDQLPRAKSIKQS